MITTEARTPGKHEPRHPGLTACIHLDRLRANARLVREQIPQGVTLMGVVKCDAYGHGAEVVAKELNAAGVGELVVGSILEGMALRRAGIACPVLVLSDPLHPRLRDALDHDLAITVADPDFAAALLRFPVRSRQRFQVQVKIDLGLCRFGVHPDQTLDIMAALHASPQIHVQGVYSHLPRTFDADPSSNAVTASQTARFRKMLDQMATRKLLPGRIHLASSTGLLGFGPELCSGHINAVRIGTLFHGFMERINTWPCRPVPVVEITAPVLQVKEVMAGQSIGYHGSHMMHANGRIAVLQAGFEHGLHADLAGVLRPLIHGHRALLVGKPALSQSMLDVSHVPEVRPGSRALLVGQGVDMSQITRSIGRGTWELLLPLLKNAHRVYRNPSP